MKKFLIAVLAIYSASALATYSDYSNIYTDLGVIGSAGTFTFDTVGSQHRNGHDIDTELGIWNAYGSLLATNDDIDYNADNYFSSITIDLGPGVYFLGASEYNSYFHDYFFIGGSRFEWWEKGTIALNIDGEHAASRKVDGKWWTRTPENAYFKVRVSGSVADVPEPSSLALIALGIAGIGFARRKAS